MDRTSRNPAFNRDSWRDGSDSHVNTSSRRTPSTNVSTVTIAISVPSAGCVYPRARIGEGLATHSGVMEAGGGRMVAAIPYFMLPVWTPVVPGIGAIPIDPWATLV